MASLGSAALVTASCSSNGTGSGGSPGDASSEAAALDVGDDTATGAAGPDGGDAGEGGAGIQFVPGTNFAVRHYYLGDTDSAGAPRATAWQDLGADVDGKMTTATSTDVCG